MFCDCLMCCCRVNCGIKGLLDSNWGPVFLVISCYLCTLYVARRGGLVTQLAYSYSFDYRLSE